MGENMNSRLRIKLMMLGDSGVGKSSILTRFTEKRFSGLIVGTAGVDFRNKTVILDGQEILLEVWDTAGQERFRSITSKYYHGAMGIILVYDVSDRNSFSNINKWLLQIRENTNLEDISIIVCGNKIDIGQKEVNEEEAREFANNNSALFIETSAKDDVNIHTLFNRIGSSIVRNKRILAKCGNNATMVREVAKKTKRQGCIFACRSKYRKF